jgi:predicted Fe-S protein YdhL (DUF1289 family)
MQQPNLGCTRNLDEISSWNGAGVRAENRPLLRGLREPETELLVLPTKNEQQEELATGTRRREILALGEKNRTHGGVLSGEDASRWETSAGGGAEMRRGDAPTAEP